MAQSTSHSILEVRVKVKVGCQGQNGLRQ